MDIIFPSLLISERNGLKPIKPKCLSHEHIVYSAGTSLPWHQWLPNFHLFIYITAFVLNKTFVYWQELTHMKWGIGRLEPYLHRFLYFVALCPLHPQTNKAIWWLVETLSRALHLLMLFRNSRSQHVFSWECSIRKGGTGHTSECQSWVQSLMGG